MNQDQDEEVTFIFVLVVITFRKLNEGQVFQYFLFIIFHHWRDIYENFLFVFLFQVWWNRCLPYMGFTWRSIISEQIILAVLVL